MAKEMIKEMRDFEQFFRHVKSLGFNAGTIIDVGVASGTKGLYGIFDNPYYVFIDAIEEYKPYMEKFLSRMRGEMHLVAVSDTPGETKIFVNPSLDASTLCYANVDQGKERPVKVETLERLLANSPIEEPVILKTDIQGYDLAAVKGAGQKLLDKTEIIVMEMSTFGSWGGKGPDFITVVKEMEKLGYVLYDVIGYLTRPSDGALGQLDIAFVKKDGMFRQNKFW